MKKLLITLIILVSPIKISAQCNENQFEILCSTFSGEWAEEISWSIINNEGTVMFTFDGAETENDNFYNNTVCLESGCYLFQANDSYGDGPPPSRASTARVCDPTYHAHQVVLKDYETKSFRD